MVFSTFLNFIKNLLIRFEFPPLGWGRVLTGPSLSNLPHDLKSSHFHLWRCSIFSITQKKTFFWQCWRLSSNSFDKSYERIFDKWIFQKQASLSWNLEIWDWWTLGGLRSAKVPRSAHSIDDCLAQKVPQGNSNNTWSTKCTHITHIQARKKTSKGNFNNTTKGISKQTKYQIPSSKNTLSFMCQLDIF